MRIALLLACLAFGLWCSPISLTAQETKADSTPSFNDGPYLFFEGGQVVARRVSGQELREDTLRAGQPLNLGKGVAPDFDPSLLDTDGSFLPDAPPAYRRVQRIAAISDIHGQYGLMVKLLQAHGIIDDNNNWSFGDGHLVVLGDIFDRGPEVTDLLWLVHKLERQAGQANGKVHYLLGNHEVMALQGDLRYIHKKYRYTMAYMGRNYDELFGEDTYLGRWLRSKPIAISINNTAFVHAGLSKTLLETGLTFRDINTMFREQIIGQPEDSILADSYLAYLYSQDGPVWYRGYFEDGFTKSQAQFILHGINKRHVVVGHTSFSEIVTLYNNRIIGIDSSIKMGKKGEIWIIEKKKLYRGTLHGERIRLK